MRKREIFETIQREWNPNEKPSERFVEAMNELILLIEHDNLKNPQEILFDNYNRLEQKISELIRESRENLHIEAEK